ncbi:protein translocase subunit SecD [Inmirania thermothiophila]|uniref:Protein translocase subunit SecD n=1 Tax=Inmirania thermothiophila TaxID=1750597 RepID=A0A3N1Y666_9GAMM|nr:protein translocase subunit SecD [Inmirania thermothiophila]ROR32807.1 preprotein translocase subunit SecD [Inmirania thermothiophila]
MNRYPLWKYALIVVVLLVGVVYALPNLYGEDPAVQVSSSRQPVDAALRERVLGTLRAQGVPFRSAELADGRLLVRMADTEAQLKAVDVLREALGPDYTVALNLAPATPAWLRAINARPMYLGLDLRGGVHFLMEVDLEAALAQAEERYVDDIRGLLREAKIRYLGIRRGADGIEIAFRDAAERAHAAERIRGTLQGLELAERDAGGVFLVARLSERERREVMRLAVQQNITTLRNRVNELGVAEPVIQQQGEGRIVVELPGVQDTARAKEIIGATATLEYRLVDTEHSVEEALAGKVPPGSRLYRTRDGRPILLKRRVIVTGDQIINAASGFDQQTGSPAVFVTLDGAGARRMLAVTRENVGKPMAVVFIENKVETRVVDGRKVRTTRRVEEVINVATIREPFGKRFQTTGLDSPEEARNLALLLRAGALAAPVQIVEERTVGPSLGADNIEQGFRAVVIGFVLVLAFMAVYYKVFGLVADLALFVNLVMVVALLSMLQATLTMPGIAGIVLTVGMAVDANVLIFERIREELRNGNTPQASIHAGYEKAFSTIADANITTLIAAAVLFTFGTGPIKGFAVTLSLGIVTSMFTAIMGTRAVINLVYGGRRLKALPI